MLRLFGRISQIGFGILIFVVVMNGSLGAAELTIGTRPEPSIDPHFLYLSTNIAYSAHIYGSLVAKDENMQIVPDLASSWEAIDDTTWEFKLRKGVKFHDGSDFTAKDVVFSIERIPRVPNNPNPYTGRIRGIVDMEIIDSHTIRIKTNKTSPLFIHNISGAMIVSKKAAEGATSADFTAGKAAIGTGPFKFEKYIPGDRLVLTRNENYWGEKPHWDKVTFRIISNDAARVSALLGGDVDMIDYVPPVDLAHLQKNKKISIFKRPTGRVIYIQVDHARDKSPFVTTKDGQALDKNPLKDLRIRRAISKAINREAICERVMEGLGVPASQIIPEGMLGHNPNIKVERYDPAGAKKLLAEAGYADGFGLTIHGPNDRYVNDAKVCQAVAQMLARIGLSMKVDTMPKNVYFPKATAPNNQFSFNLIGWGNTSGDATPAMSGCLHTYDKARNVGAYNQGLYSNPEFDRIAEKAAATVDATIRKKYLEEAMKIAMNDLAIIPLHAQFTIVATRKGLTYIPRADEETRAMGTKPAN